MTIESKKLQTDVSQLQHALDDPGHSTLGIITALRPSFLTCIHDALIAHELMDPSRKTPETPLEKEQREVIRVLVKALNSANDLGLVSYAPLHLALKAAAPYLLED